MNSARAEVNLTTSVVIIDLDMVVLFKMVEGACLQKENFVILSAVLDPERFKWGSS